PEKAHPENTEDLVAGVSITAPTALFWSALPMYHRVRCLSPRTDLTPRKSSVIQRNAQPAVKRPTVSGPSVTASLGPCWDFGLGLARGNRQARPAPEGSRLGAGLLTLTDRGAVIVGTAAACTGAVRFFSAGLLSWEDR